MTNLPSGWSAGTVKSDYNTRDQLLRQADALDVVTEKFGYDANGSLTTRKDGSDALLFRQGYDLKDRLVEADSGGDADADLRLAYDHQEGRVARHTLDGTGAVTAVVGSEQYLLDRMNPTGYEQVLEQAVRYARLLHRLAHARAPAAHHRAAPCASGPVVAPPPSPGDGARLCAIVRDSRAAARPQTAPEAQRAILAK